MYTFFHGWRRKAGVVSLVMALVVMGMWARSQVTLTLWGFPILQRQNSIWLLRERAYWTGYQTQFPIWIAHTPRYSKMVANRLEQVQELQRKKADYREWSVSYLPASAPLTLLSAYLILWKPRKRACQSVENDNAATHR